MINSIQKKVVLASIITASLVLLVGTTHDTQILAEELEKKKYTTANEIEIHAVFEFREGIEETDGFQVYKQMGGFDKMSETPEFKLEGVVSSDKVMLYEAADMFQQRSNSPTAQHNFSEFDADIYLHQNGVTLRHFTYADCKITEYKVDTFFDKEEGWTTSKGFAIVDEFEFTCRGYDQNNPLYDLMKTNGYQVSTQSSLDLDNNIETWADHPKFQN